MEGHAPHLELYCIQNADMHSIQGWVCSTCPSATKLYNYTIPVTCLNGTVDLLHWRHHATHLLHVEVHVKRQWSYENAQLHMQHTERPIVVLVSQGHTRARTWHLTASPYSSPSFGPVNSQLDKFGWFVLCNIFKGSGHYWSVLVITQNNY